MLCQQFHNVPFERTGPPSLGSTTPSHTSAAGLAWSTGPQPVCTSVSTLDLSFLATNVPLLQGLAWSRSLVWNELRQTLICSVGQWRIWLLCHLFYISFSKCISPLLNSSPWSCQKIFAPSKVACPASHFQEQVLSPVLQASE
jgi:hypothetical protein